MAAAMPKLVNLPAPKPYWNDPSESPTNFRAWLSRLNNWLALTNATLPDEHQLSDVCKNRYLYQLLGEEGGRQFSTQPAVDAITTATYADFSKNVANYFQKSISIVRARHDFGTRMQSSHESVSDYLTELRALAVDCNFQDKENEHLATQLAIGCHNSEAKKELLRKKELNLDDFVAVIEAIESASSDLSVIQGNSSDAKGAKIGASKNFQRKQKSGVRSDMRPPGKGAQAKSSSKSGPTKPCAGCGQLTHKFKSAHCPAVNVQCSYCSNVGHFERCCFKKQEANGKQVGPSGPKRNVKSLHQKCASGEHAAGYAKFNCTMFVVSRKGFVPIEAEIDTGSDATTITYSQYRTHFSAQPLKPLREPLRNFDNTSITGVLGHFGANVSINGRMQHARIFVTNDACSPVVGKNLIMPLKLLAANPAVHALKTQSATKIFDYVSYIGAQFPALLSAKLGCYPDFQHHITLSADAKPSAKCMRPVPLARRDAVACEVQTLEENDVWEKVDKSLWQHQMVTVLKPDGSYRITTDLSPLNRFVVPDRYPLPNIKELFLELKGATVFSKLDIKKAFFHIMLDEASRDLTTTLTHQGLYRYKRLPMGLKDSAAVCQRLISQTLSECEGTRAYIDDIVVYGRDRVEHDRNLHAVLQKLAEKDFRLNFAKCIFAASEIALLGHIVSGDGVKPDPKNVAPIVDAPQPATKKQVLSFLGMINYYADFLQDLASYAEPLRKLTRKNVPFRWDKHCQLSFATLKRMVANKLQVYVFDPNCPTILATDASDVGIGAVLSQLQNGREVPLAFASHTLQPRERNFSTGEREALAAVWGCEYFEKFLLGCTFTLRTDHTALQTLLASPTADQRKSSKYVRWAERLSLFDYKLEYHKGTDNCPADALSRLSLKAKELAVPDVHDTIVMKRITESGLPLSDIAAATSADPLLLKLMQIIRTRWPTKSQLSADMLPFYSIRHALSVEQGYITREDDRIIVPASLRKRLLQLAHQGHPGIVRLKRKLRETFWWPAMDRDIEHVVRHCGPCQASEKSASPPNVPVTHVSPPKRAWERIGIDIIGPFDVAPAHQRYVVVVMDHFSRFPEVLLTNDITSARILRWLSELFARYGHPAMLVSDNGPQFTSHEFAAFLHDRDIAHYNTAVYNPQENGIVENFNRTLAHGVQAFASAHTPWHTGILHILSNFRATAPAPGDLSPAEKFFNRPMRLNFQPILRKGDNQALSKSAACTQPTNAATLPRNRGPFKVGDKVLVRLPSTRKGRSPFSGPLDVVKVLGNWSYFLSDGQKWNARKLKRFHDPSQQWATVTVPPQAHLQEPFPRRSERLNKGRPPDRYSPGP